VVQGCSSADNILDYYLERLQLKSGAFNETARDRFFGSNILEVKLAFCNCSVKPEANSMKVEYFDVLVAAQIFS